MNKEDVKREENNYAFLIALAMSSLLNNNNFQAPLIPNIVINIGSNNTEELSKNVQ